MKKTLCVLFVIMLLLVSCQSGSGNESSDETVSGNNLSDDASQGNSAEESSGEPDNVDDFIAKYASCETQTDVPEMVENLTVFDGRIIISGTCESGSTVYLTADGKINGIIASDEGTFIIETTVTKGNSPLPVYIYARADGKSVSEPAETEIRYTCQTECKSQGIVWVGSDGWLFFTNTEEQYTNDKELSSRKKERITSTISERVNQLAEYGIKLVYVLIPNPNEIYPEFMPEEITKGDVCYREQIASALKASGAVVIDMGDTIESLKGGEFELYHHTDSHWTEYTAYYAYKAMCEQFVSDGFSGSIPRDISEFGFTNEYRAAGDLYYDLGLDEYEFKVNSTFSHITFDTPVDLDKYSADDRTRINDACMEYMEFFNDDSEGKPSFVMMRDSYSIMLFDWLAERSDSSYYLPLWNFDFDINNLLSLNVDYVIYFVTDMNLDNIIR